MKNPSVLLCSLPWTSLVEPSLGLGILKTKLENDFIDVKVSHLNLFLLKYMRASTYISIANMFALNEFLFTFVFEEKISKEQLSELSLRIDESLSNKVFDNDERYNDRESIAKLFLTIRNRIIPQYIIDCVRHIESYAPTMVGFTCMFDQTIPSLAVAKVLKNRNPNLFIVFGGYALEGDTGKQIIESFNFVDCVAYGEGENVIVPLAKSSVNQELLSTIPDILYRKDNAIFTSNTKKSQINLDESPIPNYDDFVEDIRMLKQDYEIEIKWNTIPIETSRGCWWGHKKHCIFCGIDDTTMKYRQRTVDSTMEMLIHLKKKYQSPFFRISDYILPHRYYSDLLPRLANIEDKEKFVFTCEIKANIKEEQFKLLKQAGFIEVQPGIESFSSNVLKKIEKGVTAIQNIFCVLLGLKYTVQINHNIIYGFPNDDIKDYKEMIKVIPLLYHLNPPSSRIKVAITRFAPLYNNPNRFGLPDTYTHRREYNILFSPDLLKSHNFKLSNYCYYFETPYSIPKELEYTYRMLDYQIDYWRTVYQTRDVYLAYEVDGNIIRFTDTRYDEQPEIKEYNLLYRDIYLFCAGAIVKIEDLYKNSNNDVSEVDSVINQLIIDRIIYREENKLLGLALPFGYYERVKEESNKWSKPYV